MASIEAPRNAPPDLGPATSEASAYLLEPTPAVVRADLVGRLATDLAAARLDGGTWLTAETVTDTALARGWRITEEIPHRTRDLRAWLRGRGSVTWKTADAHVSATEWDRRVGHRPEVGEAVTVVITGQDRAFAVERSTLHRQYDASSG
jgi:acyl-coenzyme A synthetase/AMP-(fatty) acid ligase